MKPEMCPTVHFPFPINEPAEDLNIENFNIRDTWEAAVMCVSASVLRAEAEAGQDGP